MYRLSIRRFFRCKYFNRFLQENSLKRACGTCTLRTIWFQTVFEKMCAAARKRIKILVFFLILKQTQAYSRALHSNVENNEIKKG